MEKEKVITFYIIILVAFILEIVFLFHIPYYYYSRYLKYLKIIRIIFGFCILLIEVYLKAVSFSEQLLDIKREEKDKKVKDLIDKILIIGGFVISITNFVLNIIGIGLTTKYLKEVNETDLQNKYHICSLLLLFENILISIVWICFSIYYGFSIYNSFSKEINEKEDNNIRDKENKAKENQEESKKEEVPFDNNIKGSNSSRRNFDDNNNQ